MLCIILVTSNPIEKSIQMYLGNKNLQLKYTFNENQALPDESYKKR